MHAAAQNGHLEVCKFLHSNGARHHIWEELYVPGQAPFTRGNGEGWTPFHFAACYDREEVLRWLTLHGALCANSSSVTVEGDHIYPKGAWTRLQKVRISHSCEQLVEWAKEVTQTHSATVTFLLGALPPAPGKDQSRTLQCLSGHPGVRKHIADFVGLEVTKGKHLRILRNVVDVLPSRIEN